MIDSSGFLAPPRGPRPVGPHPSGWKQRSLLCYQRAGAVARLTLKGMVNHETRDVIVGLWARLDAEDRADLIAELTHYHTEPDGHLAAIAGLTARAIADADGQAVDVRALPRVQTPDDLPP